MNMESVRKNVNNIANEILKALPYYRLKDLIKAVRACKTASEERAVITKESAAIRTSIRDENNEARYFNVSKLLYIHMLGYSAHFGQMECLKLVASPRYADKRLGYLGIMLLLDENQEVLTLVTNSLKNDMNHSNMYIVGLALCTLGNISSPEMARDLCAEVEKLLGSSNTYIRKKAALCALRIIKKVPDLQENFMSKAKSLLNDRNHGVLVTGLTLVIEMCLQSLDTTVQFRKAVPLLVRHLKNLVTAGFSPEHDVTGVTDPFLQVKILHLLRILGTDDAETSEQMNDVLAQVATNTESIKNVGNAILYETVLTIMDVQSEAGLRVLAVNILGKFLSNRDNNIRYVALETLNKTVHVDNQAVQRHRNIILDCLRDGDISIRRRALELSFALINEGNVRVLTRELLAFLEVADTEFKQGMTTKICLVAERFAPNKRWHIDTVLRVLKLAGNFVREEILAAFIRLVAQSAELQQYTVQKLYSSLKNDISQEALVLAGVWVIGEYGDVLVRGGISEEEELVKEVTEGDVLNLLTSILSGPYANQVTREYVLTSLMKLTSRFSTSEVVSSIKQILESYSKSMEVEIQQRAVEFVNLFGLSGRAAILEKMPVPEVRPIVSQEELVSGRGSTTVDRGGTPTQNKGPSDQDLLLDLMGVGIAGTNTTTTSTSISSSSSTPKPAPQSQNSVDFLADIFGETPVSSQPTATSYKPSVSQRSSDILDLFGDSAPVLSGSSIPESNSLVDSSDLLAGLSGLSIPSGTSSTQQPTFRPTYQTNTNSSSFTPPSSTQGFQAYSKNGFLIRFRPARDPTNPNIVNITVIFSNDGSQGVISKILFQAAVPKTQRLQMQTPSSTTVPPGGEATQVMRVANPNQTPLKFRLKISYFTEISGAQVDDVADFGGFPDGSF